MLLNLGKEIGEKQQKQELCWNAHNVEVLLVRNER